MSSFYIKSSKDGVIAAPENKANAQIAVLNQNLTD